MSGNDTVVEDGVVFVPKNPRQKSDCINRSAEYQCPNLSSLEAVYGNAQIRCCHERSCKARAAQMAILAAF